MRVYILQIIHRLENGGENIIETEYDKPYQVDAAIRRHKKMPHTATCEMYRFVEEREECSCECGFCTRSDDSMDYNRHLAADCHVGQEVA